MAGVPKFDRQAVLLEAAKTFVLRGYEGSTVSHLVAATGLQRGSLYNAFGSKAEFFQITFEELAAGDVESELLLDMLVVALKERCTADPRVTEQAIVVLSRLEAGATPVAQQIYHRLLSHAGLETTFGTGHSEEGRHTWLM